MKYVALPVFLHFTAVVAHRIHLLYSNSKLGKSFEALAFIELVTGPVLAWYL